MKMSSWCLQNANCLTITKIGSVFYVNKSSSSSLAFVNDANRAIIKVDNTTFVPYNDKRNSVRITTQDYFGVGTVWVIDATHLPFGCSVSEERSLTFR